MLGNFLAFRRVKEGGFSPPMLGTENSVECLPDIPVLYSVYRHSATIISGPGVVLCIFYYPTVLTFYVQNSMVSFD